MSVFPSYISGRFAALCAATLILLMLAPCAGAQMDQYPWSVSSPQGRDTGQSAAQAQQNRQRAIHGSGQSYCDQPENVGLPECAGYGETLPRIDGSEWPVDGATVPFPPVQSSSPYDPYSDRTYPNRSSELDRAYPMRSRPVPPEPATEFQQYVASSVGRILPIYGASLFNRVPSTFAPVDRAPVTSDYVIGPGDEFDLNLWGQVNIRQQLAVNRSGDVFIRGVGPVHVAGLRYSNLQNALRTAVGRVYTNFDLSANMGQLRSIQIFVVGQARHPGSYTVGAFSTVVDALFASGGPSSRGSMRHVQLRRAGKIVCDFDLYDLLLRGDKSDDPRLESGDVLFIPAAGARIAIAGSVESPGIYELRGETTVSQAIEYANGLSPVAASRRAVLERIDQHASLRTQEVPLSGAGLETDLKNGDIIRLLPVVPHFDNAVSLRGNVADPGRFPWYPGMRVSDLIPNRESLLTRDYWRERNRLSAETATGATDANGSGTRSGEQASTTTPQNGYVPVLLQPSANMTDRKQIFHESVRNTTADSSLAAASSAEDAPPVRQFVPRNDVQPPAPNIDWNYAVIERLDKTTFTTYLIPFNLGRAVIDHDSKSDIALQPRDVVTIFSTADFSVPASQQTKYVRLEGEVKMAGVYTAKPGETLRQVVERAGGLTDSAYLFGAQFTRLSTQREQQKRFNEFLDTLEREVDQNAATLNGRVTALDQTGAAQSSIANQRTLIERLRQTPVSGRIVLDLDPTSSGVNALPDIALENGDRFYIPRRPPTVNVVGTVYNQASFLYDSGQTLSDYLNEAGGPTRQADKSHIFVIRADGSVVAKSGGSELFRHKFAALRMYPGDTVIVPTYTNKTTILRGLIDWSQVFSSFGIAAAAVNVLR